MTAQHRAPMPETMSVERFLEMTSARPDHERWELIDGEPCLMMTPPTLVHQRIALNLALRLNDAFDIGRHELVALIEIGLMVESRDDFRPIVDLAVVASETESIHYASKFYLAAEVLSTSKTREQISRKRAYYSQAPDCLHVLIIAQDDFCVEVWSRSHGWQGRVFRSADDVIDLPEFGFSCRLGDLYRGTPVR